MKPNQPNQIKTVPRKIKVVLCGLPCDFSPVCFLLPKAKAYASADHPEEMWTGPPPAKSKLGSLYNHPLGFHVQQAMGQYTYFLISMESEFSEKAKATYNCRPEKRKDHGWHDASTLERSTDYELNCASTEHQLVQAEYNLGYI